MSSLAELSKSVRAKSATSSKLIACIPSRDAATRFSDITGNARHLLVEASNANAFSVDGYFNTTAAVNGGLNIPQAQIRWNPFWESMILSFVLRRAIPAANEIILSLGTNIAGYQGFYLSHRTGTGIIKLIPRLNSGSAGTDVDSNLTFSDGTPKDRVCTIAFDAPTGSWYMWRDGIITISAVGLSTGAKTMSDAVSLAELRVGGLSAINTTAMVAVQGRALQFAKFVGSLPTNVGLIAARLAETPGLPITESEW